MMKRLSVVLLIILSSAVQAQQLRPASSAQIYHELNQLKHLTNVLYLAAHPDDENTRMIGWLVNEQHVPTAYLSLTRGDGGQNILGPHLGPALGLIRTHELLAARELDGGAGQYFTRAVDFGYSKTAEETFKHWDKDLLTGDAVWAIRQFKPDVIICRFPPNRNAGHGQHAASAIIGHEAFKLAGDKTAYKDQFRYVQPWQPTRIFFNAYRFGSRNTTREDQLKVEVGQYNSLLGMGYGELAGISRSIHRSQGAGTRSVPGVQTEYMALVDGEPAEKTIFDGIDITWGRIGRKDIGEQIEKIIQAYDFNHPEKSLPALLSLYKEVKHVKDNDWKYQKIAELEKLILHTSGFMAEIYARQPEVVRGEQIEFIMNFIARSGDVKVRLEDVQCLEQDTVCHLFMPYDELMTIKRTLTIPTNASYTEPYWLSQPQTDPAHYPIPDYKMLGKPNTPNELTAKMRVQVGDETLLVEIPLSYKVLDPTHGDVVEQLRVVPEVILNFTDQKVTLSEDGRVHMKLHIRTKTAIRDGKVNLRGKLNGGDFIQTTNKLFVPANVDTTIDVVIAKHVFEDVKESAVVQVSIEDSDAVYDKEQHTIKYEHLPTLQFYTKPQIQVIPRNWVVKPLKVAYVEGAGDDVVSALQFAGVTVDILKEEDITPDNVRGYDAVLVGIRAINVKEQSPVWISTLLKYAKAGGTLVMQYNTAHRLKTKDFAPYKLELSRKRVTEEDAEMKVLVPDHRLLNYPNKITQADFDNWVQERGLYFADEWDERFTPLFSTHDTGEDPLKGSTLYAPYGKGHYIYTSLSFFRQLPAGNVGAVRLLLNFISVGK